MSVPSDVSFDTIVATADLPGSLYNESKPIVYTDLVVDETPLCFHLIGTLTSDAIMVSQYGQHTIGFEFGNPAEQVAFGRLMNFFDTVPGLDGEWKVTDLLKNQRLYLKLKHKNNKYVFGSNVELDPRKAVTAPFRRGQKVDAYVALKAYFNSKEKQCGFYFEVLDVKVETVGKKSIETVDAATSPIKLRRV